jgi:hypothetical protein
MKQGMLPRSGLLATMCSEEGVTPKLVTLDFVQNQHPSFDTPKVIHHGFDKDQSYLFLEARLAIGGVPARLKYRYTVSSSGQQRSPALAGRTVKPHLP